jgi:hypothetical protein
MIRSDLGEWRLLGICMSDVDIHVRKILDDVLIRLRLNRRDAISTGISKNII